MRKQIQGYEGIYEIEAGMVSQPKVFRIDGKKPKEVKPYNGRSDKKGGHYLRLALWKNNERSQWHLHILVAKMFISNPKNKPFVDHEDGDGQNNSLLNLRWATQSENSLNSGNYITKQSSNYKNVYFDSNNNSWEAKIFFKGKSRRAGRFKSEKGAARASDRLAKSLGIEDWRGLNFPRDYCLDFSLGKCNNGKIMNNLLEKTKTYLVGHMQYLSGRNWREEVSEQLQPLGITCFDPYKKPFIKDVEEDESSRQDMETWMKTKQYDRVTEKMKMVRAYDLNLVDRSDFIIAHLVPDVASWGSAEEIVTAVREKKPVFVSMEGGKAKAPLWMLGMFPHKYIYNSLDEIVEMLYAIDNGSKEIDSDRWRLLRKEFR